MKHLWKRLGQQGVMFVVTAFLLPFVIGMTGLTVDFGKAYYQKSKLQNATDAAALAGAYEIGDDKKVKSTVQTYLEKNTEYASISYNESETAPDDETAAIYKREYPTSDELDVTMRANVKSSFLKLFGIDKIPVSALSKAKVSQEDGLTDDMFKYCIIAAHSPSSNYNPKDWQSWQSDYSIWFDAEGMEIGGDIMTNGKINFNQSAKSYLNGTLNISKNGENTGTAFSEGFWRNNKYYTKDYNPGVWGTYGWNNGTMEWYTLVDENGNPLLKETTGSNGHLVDVDTDRVVKQDNDIDISLDKNPSLKKLLQSYKAMSEEERLRKHIFYDDDKSHTNEYRFTTDEQYVKEYPALFAPVGGAKWSSGEYFSSIVVPNDLQLDTHANAPAPGEDDYAIVISLYGNIRIENNMVFRGLLYAPNGDILIDGSAKVLGNVIGQRIKMTTPNQKVRGANYVKSISTRKGSGKKTVHLIT